MIERQDNLEAELNDPPLHEDHCERCGNRWPSETIIESRVKLEFARHLRANQSIEAIRLIREAAGISLRDAKAFCLHVSRVRGHCHRCGGDLDGTEKTVCSKCHSLNYDW